MSELKAISGNEIREDIDYNTRGVDPEDKEWRNYGKELCDTLYYRKSEADKVIAKKDMEIFNLKEELSYIKADSTFDRDEYEELLKSKDAEIADKDKFIADLEESHKKEVEQLLMKIAGLEKLVDIADKLVKQKGGFTVKDIEFKGVKLEGVKND